MFLFLTAWGSAQGKSIFFFFIFWLFLKKIKKWITQKLIFKIWPLDATDEGVVPVHMARLGLHGVKLLVHMAWLLHRSHQMDQRDRKWPDLKNKFWPDSFLKNFKMAKIWKKSSNDVDMSYCWKEPCIPMPPPPPTHTTHTSDSQLLNRVC
jgi:hypothetical protein